MRSDVVDYELERSGKYMPAVVGGVFWMTMFLSFGLPVIGWLCNIVAMKFYELDKDRMVQVQKNIAEMKEK